MEVIGNVIEHLTVYDVHFQYQNPNSDFATLKYVVPADNDMCIYDIKFAYGDEILECKVKSRDEAFQEHRQLEQEGWETTFAESGPSGKIEVRAANVPPYETVRMSMKVSSFARLSGRNTISISFPVKFINDQEICSFFADCSNDFDFHYQLKALPSMFAQKPTSNVFYQLENDTITVNGILNTSSLFFNFCSQIMNKTSILISDQYMAVNLYPRRDDFIASNIGEYVLGVDCSGSMSGKEIELAEQS
jgi:hypothetical protein